MKYNPNIEEIAALMERTKEQFEELFKKYGE